MEKIEKIINKLKEDSVKFHHSPSLYSTVQIDLVTAAKDRTPDWDGWVYVGNIELEFLVRKGARIPKDRKRKNDFINIHSPLYCLKWKVIKEVVEDASGFYAH